MLDDLSSPVFKLLSLKLITLSISKRASYRFSYEHIFVGIDPRDIIKFNAMSYFFEGYLCDNLLYIFL
jgi:hypothetical protein